MTFKNFKGLITTPVGNSRGNLPRDILRVKDRLQSAGDMEKEKEPHGYITREMDDAIRGFQKEKGLKVDGFMLPGGETERALIEAVKNPNQYLEFDGRELRHMRNGVATDKWKAVSGRKDFQGYKYQDKVYKGPIPEGEWIGKQSQHQRIQDITSWDRIRSSVGFGTWGGLENSWGEDRVWLEPEEKTNVFKRSGFSIHGGAVPGSAGCIDLTNEMPDFIEKFKKINKDLKLKVCYPRP